MDESPSESVEPIVEALRDAKKQREPSNQKEIRSSLSACASVVICVVIGTGLFFLLAFSLCLYAISRPGAIGGG